MQFIFFGFFRISFNLKLATFELKGVPKKYCMPLDQQTCNLNILQKPQSIIPRLSSSHSDHAAPRLVALRARSPCFDTKALSRLSAAGPRGFLRELFPDPDPQPWRCPSPLAPPRCEVSPLANCKVRARPSWPAKGAFRISAQPFHCSDL